MLTSDKKAAVIPQDIWEVAVKKEVQKVIFNKNALTSWPTVYVWLNERSELSVKFYACIYTVLLDC